MHMYLFAHRDERNGKLDVDSFRADLTNPVCFFFPVILGNHTEVKGLKCVVTLSFKKVGSKAPLHLQPYLG